VSNVSFCGILGVRSGQKLNAASEIHAGRPSPRRFAKGRGRGQYHWHVRSTDAGAFHSGVRVIAEISFHFSVGCQVSVPRRRLSPTPLQIRNGAVGEVPAFDSLVRQ